MRNSIWALSTRSWRGQSLARCRAGGSKTRWLWRNLGLDAKPEATPNANGFPTARQRETPIRVIAGAAETEAHRAFVADLKGDAVWEKIWSRRTRDLPN